MAKSNSTFSDPASDRNSNAIAGHDSNGDATAKFRALFSLPDIAILELDYDLNCIDANATWQKLTGITVKEALGQGWLAGLNPSDARSLNDSLPRSIAACESFQLDLRVKQTEAEPRWLRARASPIGESRSRYFVLLQDITEFMAKEQHLENVAQRDPLTGLLNRTAYYNQLDIALCGVGRLGSVALMFIDLDGFKQINDRYGHDVGDDLLKEVAIRLRSSLRKVDILARVGGDEFNIALTHIEEVRSVVTVANKILSSLSQSFHLKNRSLHISCSIGIAVAQQEGRPRESLIKQADTALYKAKQAGKNQFQFYTAALNRSAHIEAQLRNSLRDAQNRDLSIVFQPQINADTGQISAIEALARWEHEALGKVSAHAIIKIMEDTGLINDFSGLLFNRAFHAASSWQKRFNKDIKVAVNLSSRQLRNPDLPVTLYRAAKRHGLTPDDIILEINEQVIGSIPDLASEALRNLSRMGFHIALDDFGTGHSSLANLQTLPLSSIKIDRSFIQDVTVDPTQAKIVAATLDLAEALNLTVVAEGVETLELKNWLLSHGCKMHQGHYYYAATKAEKLEKLIAQHNAALPLSAANVGFISDSS